jgi:hypothetical protein
MSALKLLSDENEREATIGELLKVITDVIQEEARNTLGANLLLLN